MMQGELHRWYENCEMRSIVLSDDAGSGNVDPLWFPGGHQLQREGKPLIHSIFGLQPCLLCQCTWSPLDPGQPCEMLHLSAAHDS